MATEAGNVLDESIEQHQTPASLQRSPFMGRVETALLNKYFADKL